MGTAKNVSSNQGNGTVNRRKSSTTPSLYKSTSSSSIVVGIGYLSFVLTPNPAEFPPNPARNFTCETCVETHVKRVEFTG